MGFFSSKKNKSENEEEQKGLPKLPSLPELPKNRQIPNQIQVKKPEKKSSLPQFPSSELGEKMNQNTIKEAVIKNPLEKTPYPKLPEKNLTHEINNQLPPLRPNIPQPKMRRGISKPRSIEISGMEPQMPQYPKPQISEPREAEPLFIKLDTFEKAISSFNEIKLRMSEMETLLKNIQEIKDQEERELNNWEHEIETIKARLEQINKEIFDKIE